MQIEHQMPRDGKQPGFELRLAIVLIAAVQNADPGLLKQVFGRLRPGGQIEQIAEEALLILLDQAIEQIGIAPPQSARQRLTILSQIRREE